MPSLSFFGEIEASSGLPENNVAALASAKVDKKSRLAIFMISSLMVVVVR
jgi:hypothetical protein